MAERVLDTTGLSCPLPILKARRTLRNMARGQTLEVLATDPLAVEDFSDFCRTQGHELLESTTAAGDVYRFVIRNGGQQASE
ncbi:MULTISPECIES: sulfurtransferase TusA family protein [Rhodomicrobium]|uniref:sulfurtransferase TusA family protein n=1 Tax=Rhodomicrobium TaxID=1068 RepID=UPI000B4B36DC|nr:MULTISPECIES: sulfurtransferase TusA family protein [Rhodomicrobium]